MPIALALALVATVGGAVASYSYDDDAPLGARLAYGATTGFLALGFAGFIAATLAGPLSGPYAAAAVAALPLLAFARGDVRARFGGDARAAVARVADGIRHPGLSTTGPLVFWAAIVALLWVAFDRVIVENDGTLATGFVNNLGDLPFHIGIVSGFAYGQNYPPENPIFAGSGFSYPYIADVVTAQFVQLGATMREAFFVQNLILGLALVGLLQRFAAVLTGDRLASFIAPLIVLFSGGLGWLLLFDQARVGEQGLVEPDRQPAAGLHADRRGAAPLRQRDHHAARHAAQSRARPAGGPDRVRRAVAVRPRPGPVGRPAGPRVPATWGAASSATASRLPRRS